MNKLPSMCLGHDCPQFDVEVKALNRNPWINQGGRGTLENALGRVCSNVGGCVVVEHIPGGMANEVASYIKEAK
jgi:hypothetical protein